MVSAGTVLGNSDEFNQVSNEYTGLIEELSSSWQGSSHDNVVSQSADFNSEMQQVTQQFSSFATAVTAYENYKDVKDKYQSYVNTYNNQIRFSNDQSLINQYNYYISDCEAKMSEYSNQIQSALSDASSFTLEATSLKAPGLAVSGSGGEFVSDSSYGVYGYIQSSIDGKTHTVYNQSQISGWSGDCNRAAAASIASAYASYSGEAVDIAQGSQNGIGYISDVTNNYFSNFGLTASVNNIQGSYDSVKSDIVSTLSNGDYVMFDLSQPNVYGASGQKWTSQRHWVSILDIKSTGPGDNDYAIFVSDSGHGGSAVDHGLGTGWYSLDEFSGQRISTYTTVSSI